MILAVGCGGAQPAAIEPGIELLDHTGHLKDPLHVYRVARRVERIRGLSFERMPRVVVMQPEQLQRLGARIKQHSLDALREEGHLAHVRFVQNLQSQFDTVTGLLPSRDETDSSARGASEQIGGAYDFIHHRVVVVDRVAQSRHQLALVLAHELTHALEDQHFALHIATSRGEGQSAQVRRALTEGTATFVAAVYDGRYLRNRLPLSVRIGGQRSVFAAGGSTPFAVKANTIFDYVDGPLFVQHLYRRGGESWRQVNAAIRRPPHVTRDVLEPRVWPNGPPPQPVGLDLGPALPSGSTLVGSAPAGEQDIRTLFSAGAPDLTVATAAAGWQGGRFEVWRLPGGSCDGPCPSDDVAVAAFRLSARGDVPEFATAFLDYALLGRLGQQVNGHTWDFEGGGTGSIASWGRSVAIAYAPDSGLAQALARRAARGAA